MAEPSITGKVPAVKVVAVNEAQLRDRLPWLPSNVTLLRWEKSGEFPRRLSAGNRIYFWLWEDIETWLREKKNTAASDLVARGGAVRHLVEGRARKRSEQVADAA